MPIETLNDNGKTVLIANKTKDIASFEAAQKAYPSAAKKGMANNKTVAFEDAKAHLSR